MELFVVLADVIINEAVGDGGLTIKTIKVAVGVIGFSLKKGNGKEHRLREINVLFLIYGQEV